MMFRWICYGVIDPRDFVVFYVGITRKTWRHRLGQHTVDPASSAYGRLQEIRESRKQAFSVVFKSFDTEQEARNFEDALIALIGRDLTNSQRNWPWNAEIARNANGEWISNRGDLAVEPVYDDDGSAPYTSLRPRKPTDREADMILDAKWRGRELGIENDDDLNPLRATEKGHD